MPPAAQLPRTSGSVARKRTTAAAAKGTERLLRGPGGGAPRNAGGCGGAQPPRPTQPSKKLTFCLHPKDFQGASHLSGAAALPGKFLSLIITFWTVVASGVSKASNIIGLGLFKHLWPTVTLVSHCSRGLRPLLSLNVMHSPVRAVRRSAFVFLSLCLSVHLALPHSPLQHPTSVGAL